LKINKNQPVIKELLINCEALSKSKCDKMPQKSRYWVQCICSIQESRKSYQDRINTFIILSNDGIFYLITLEIIRTHMNFANTKEKDKYLLQGLYLHCKTNKNDYRVNDIYSKYHEIQINEIVPEFANKQGEHVECFVQLIPDGAYWSQWDDYQLPISEKKKGNFTECFIKFCADFAGINVIFGSYNNIRKYLCKFEDMF